MDNLPERGMGLRIIDACTDTLSYAPTDGGRHRLEFSIPADHDPWLSKLF
jgi:serine/threonine-protein kinase RsbW